MASYTTMSSTRLSDDTMDDENDDKDDTKRKSRNLSEKKRRDQFNMLVNELGNMVSTNTRKMDKSTVLKSTILFLKNHNEVAVRSRVHEIQEDWKPSFLSNEEFTHLILEALDGFIMIFSSNGRIYYASESVTALLGYLPTDLANSTIYEITYQDDQSFLYNMLLNPTPRDNPLKSDIQVSFTCHIKRGSLDFRENVTYERVHFVGYFRSGNDIETLIPPSRYTTNPPNDTKMVFVGTGRLHTPQLIREVSLIDTNKSEFGSKHSLEWKFLFLDQRASPIIGYLPFEVLGTSGYDYYHVDDLDKVVTSHESLMRKGEGTSCFYRFLTKGQQWIWLQTRFYIDYNQWNSKPEFIVCTHTVVNSSEVIKHQKKSEDPQVVDHPAVAEHQPTPCQTPRSTWSPKSPKTSRSVRNFYGADSDTSISLGSVSSRVSASTTQSSKPKTSANAQAKATPMQQEAPHQTTSRTGDGCLGYGTRYSEPVLSVVPGEFLTPAAPTVSLSVPGMLVNQPSIVMTNSLSQNQDELQRKHEELQQLIVHQQEELRRVSEQLFIARYGILSPLMNVGVNYGVNTIPGREGVTGEGIFAGEGVQGVSGAVTIPVTVPVSIVPVESFERSAAVVPITSVVDGGVAAPVQGQGVFMQQRVQTTGRSEGIHMQGVQETGQIMPFQICQQPEILYHSGERSSNGQFRLPRI
ncbi:circadian locomoter output cycles protein kaput isoform X2 [Fopius arisanus]|uniref:Circadian locomoter output cycles protein kaput isoform X2 n=1 Tax=Fopius arisanus TaxID=64838 RepID=A0A9R1SWZ2_9HYME|nr:PREDICTED: circadian locomoter output cycles protein kaput isoform X2 [Fopius arisanus]